MEESKEKRVSLWCVLCEDSFGGGNHQFFNLAGRLLKDHRTKMQRVPCCQMCASPFLGKKFRGYSSPYLLHFLQNDASYG